jgi:hypothetical protein
MLLVWIFVLCAVLEAYTFIKYLVVVGIVNTYAFRGKTEYKIVIGSTRNITRKTEASGRVM